MQTLTTNRAGGTAYNLDAKEALAKYAVAGTFNNTYNIAASQDVQNILKYAALCESEFLAKTAIYSRSYGRMKDMSVLLTAYLSTREDKTYFRAAFKDVCNNVGQIRKFVQVIRSGVVGRKSLGSAPKSAIQRFFKSKSAERLFWQAFGTNPSIADVIRLARPYPETAEKDALYAYFISKEYKIEDLPKKVQDFENFKKGDTTEVPDVPWNRLTSLPLTEDQWRTVFRNMTWTQLLKQTNTAQRKGLFSDTEFTTWYANRLRDPEAVSKTKVLPFSILKALDSLSDEVPSNIKDAITDAVEVSTQNAPAIVGNVAIILDTSGSMQSPAIRADTNRGWHLRRSSKTSCIQAASYLAGSLFKSVEGNSVIIPVDVEVHPAVGINQDVKVADLARYLARFGGGGTNLSIGMHHIAQLDPIPDLVVIISDMESWVDGDRFHREYYTGTGTMGHWKTIKAKNPNAKLVCWDITPNHTSQAPSSKDIMNVGGLSDVVFEMIAIFHESKGAHSWIDLIEEIPLH